MRQRRRLNLLAFAPETDALFSMLIVASLMLALFFGNVFRIYAGLDDPFASIDITARGLELARASLPGILLSGLAALGTLGLALLFYLRHPAHIRRRRDLQPLTGKDRALEEAASRLALEAGVEPPRIEMPLEGLRGTGAQAFGAGRARIIALDGGFRILRRTRPRIFEAILHHELAHFANGDVGRSYFSDALWRSVRWLLVFPFLLALAGSVLAGLFSAILGRGSLALALAAIPGVLVLFVQWGFVLFIAGAIWARLLRARELYADWRAASWGSGDGLEEILREGTAAHAARRKLWQVHPDPAQRIDALHHPEKLFRASPALVFLAGLLLSFLFAGLYFSFAVFFAFAGAVLSLREAATGLVYWALTGVWWSGFLLLVAAIFGSAGWLMNSVLLPQVQKQAVLDLLKGQRGLAPYAKLGIHSLLFVAGIELGLFLTPFSQLAPDGLSGVLVEVFVVAPLLVLLGWWYLVYLRFLSLRLAAAQTGTSFSIWRSRFLRLASAVWVFLFFMPGLVLSRFLDGPVGELFIYLSLGWLAFTILLSPVVVAGSWAAIRLLVDGRPKTCPHCGKTTSHPAPAVEQCRHCEGILGEWLFVPEDPRRNR